MKALRVSLACYLFAVIAATPTYSAQDRFSNAHRQMQRYFEHEPAFATHKAMWLRHNRLLLSADIERVKPKKLAKTACGLLLRNGFTGMDLAVAVSDHRELLRGNRFDAVKELYCER